jgi:hypothetical protein
MSTRLSKWFDLEEFTASQVATRMGLVIVPTRSIIDNLAALASRVLDPLREQLQRPIIITSGYRPPEVNEAIRGSARSQHLRGEAADFVVRGVAPAVVIAHMRKLELPVDQCILEFGQWVHVSHRLYGPQRGEYLRAERAPTGVVHYTPL